MHRLRLVFLATALALGSFIALYAQNVPGSGWSSFGLLPFRGYDFVIIKAPTRYILYYTRHSTTSVEESGSDTRGRAFTTDFKSWTVDTGDICATSGDYCKGVRAGAMTLPDGRMRMFINPGGGVLNSAISTDGLVWTLEAGARLTQDPSSIYERGNYALELVSVVSLPDGSFRMYYEGGVVPGTAGTPAYYNSIFVDGAILSAVSKDNGLTWVRDPGVRINPIVQGPSVNLTISGVSQSQTNATDLSAVAVTENGRLVYRIYGPSLVDGAVSYISYDGLTFTLEGQAPTAAGDPKAFVLPDGRTVLISNQYPDAINDVLVYGPQSLFLNPVKAAITALPGAFPAFQSASISVTGSSSGLVTLQAASDDGTNCPNQPCSFHPEYYSFSPASGTPPFSSTVAYTGPSTYSASSLFVHAKAADVTAVGAIYCMNIPVGRPDDTIFCQTANAALPMNQMNFAFTSGAPASSQTSTILSLGGSGYPFTVSSSVPWATVSPASGTAPQVITVKVDPTTLAAGSYTGIVTISAEGTTEQITVTAVVSAAPAILSVVNGASFTGTIAPNTFVTIFGGGFATAVAGWAPTTTLPTTLGGVSVKINGKDAFVNYADTGQVNVLAPPDTAVGAVPVQVTTALGTTTANATMVQVAPAWFTYTVGTRTWVAALFANTSIYVAPAGSLSSQSRSAKAGDFLQLYASGLGATNPPAPVGVVLSAAYPLDDLSRVKVTIAGQPVTVLYAGLTYAGVYQVNVQVPSGLATGELPVVMTVNGQVTQAATLNFQ